MSITAVGSSLTDNGSLEAYLLRQERIATYQQEASEIAGFRSPSFNTVENTATNSSYSSSTNSSINNQNVTAVSSSANTNTNTNASASSSTSTTTAASYYDPTGNPFSVMATQFDIASQISAMQNPFITI